MYLLMHLIQLKNQYFVMIKAQIRT